MTHLPFPLIFPLASTHCIAATTGYRVTHPPPLRHLFGWPSCRRRLPPISFLPLQLCEPPLSFFFLEYATELHIIALRRIKELRINPLVPSSATAVRHGRYSAMAAVTERHMSHQSSPLRNTSKYRIELAKANEAQSGCNNGRSSGNFGPRVRRTWRRGKRGSSGRRESNGASGHNDFGVVVCGGWILPAGGEAHMRRRGWSPQVPRSRYSGVAHLTCVVIVIYTFNLFFWPNCLLLPPFQKICNYGLHVIKSGSCLTKFLESCK